MIAEIYNKISSDGTNLTDRLEDQLTGDFFGSLRYLPFEEGLANVLQCVRFNDENNQRQWNHLLTSVSGYDVEIKFWLKHSFGEIDLLIIIGSVHIGIEVKYLSGISSDDDEQEILHTDYQNSRYQLSRYSRMLSRLSNGSTSYLLFLAPFSMMSAVKEEINKRSIIEPSVRLGFFSWQEAYQSLEKTTFVDKGKQLIIEDLKQLLHKKRFKSFDGFDIELLQKEISEDSYRFKVNKEKFTWKWSIEEIKGDSYYVYF
jgi:hypothetical protein